MDQEGLNSAGDELAHIPISQEEGEIPNREVVPRRGLRGRARRGRRARRARVSRKGRPAQRQQSDSSELHSESSEESDCTDGSASENDESEESDSDSDVPSEVLISSGQSFADTVAEAIAHLNDSGTVTLSARNTDIPNLALVFEMLRNTSGQPLETIETKLSLTLAGSVGQNVDRYQYRCHKEIEDWSSSDDEETPKNYKYVRMRRNPLYGVWNSCPGTWIVARRIPLKAYLRDAFVWFQRDNHQEARLKAYSRAIPRAIGLAESIKRMIAGLHQLVTFHRISVTDVYEPLETGLDTVTRDKQVPVIDILLGYNLQFQQYSGYQSPFPDSLVTGCPPGLFESN